MAGQQLTSVCTSEKKDADKWKDIEIKALLSIWKSRIHDLRRLKRNRVVYQSMAEEMAALGVPKRAIQIQAKLKHLTARYRKELKKVGPSGGSPSDWLHFPGIHSILASFPLNNPELMEESLEEQSPAGLLHEIQRGQGECAIHEVEETEHYNDDSLMPCSGSGNSDLSRSSVATSEPSTSEHNPVTSERRRFLVERHRNKKRGEKHQAVALLLEKLDGFEKDSKERDDEMIRLIREQNSLYAESVQLQRTFNDMFSHFLTEMNKST